MQSHRNVLHNVLKLTNGLRLSAADRLTLLSSVSFGASVSDIYGALLNGAVLHPIPLSGDGLRLLPRRVAEAGITVYHSIPGVFRSLVAARDGTEDLWVFGSSGWAASRCSRPTSSSTGGTFRELAASTRGSERPRCR